MAVRAEISGEGVVLGKYFLVSTKLDTFCYPAVQTVRPSVRLCVTSRCSTETAKRRITQTTPRNSTRDPSFLMPKISTKLTRGHPQRRRQLQVMYVKCS